MRARARARACVVWTLVLYLQVVVTDGVAVLYRCLVVQRLMFCLHSWTKYTNQRLPDYSTKYLSSHVILFFIHMRIVMDRHSDLFLRWMCAFRMPIQNPTVCRLCGIANHPQRLPTVDDVNGDTK